MRPSLLVFISVFQLILFTAHFMVFETWMHFWAPTSFAGVLVLKAGLLILSISFVAGSLLSFRYWNAPVRAVYRVAAVWLGIFNFLFLAALGAWLSTLAASLAGLHPNHRALAAFWFGTALLAAFWGLINASVTRISRIKIRLPNLPAAWRGRSAAMISDLHLGHVRGANFARNIVASIRQLKPEIVFLAGDLYDGSHADLDALASPLRGLNAPLGNFFVAGNHEEIQNPAGHLKAAKNAGLRLLNNEKITVDGLQIIGVHHRDAAHPQRLNSVLEGAAIDRDQPSVLIVHAPDQLAVAERAGISLQLSGHTHRGQFFPWTWLTKRIYKQFVYGLQKFGDMFVYTSSGAGTWGPPMRVCSHPEIVLIQFE
jgi:predicted MPP superfamily phosphohydrolase